MRVRALDNNGDMTFGNSSQDYLVDSPAAVAQLIYTALLLFLGEWFLDPTAGVPWLTAVIGINTAGTRDLAIKDCILAQPGVVSILTYNSALQGSTFTVSGLTVETSYGVATVPQIGVPVPSGA